ncbi:hypothetical protein [Candidatus Tokpelaia sp.]|uniref:hypothetical protein n=1 Tax=Candidatus Tokpelaia sp. TaxID=2233777 RepID=UPI00123C2F6D|nr:hypothetical protein [Candidatus Tokpelaia sp.]KAA6406292.1 hypothetical protein DPQ22_00265 [Candidatus Tokpelaia sp.]
MFFRYAVFLLTIWLSFIGNAVFTGGKAVAQALLQAQAMSKADAANAGYKRQIFSFQAPNLDFETYIPQKAEVKTLPYKTEPIPAGQIGRVLPIGQVSFTKGNTAYEDIIFSYRLRSPPAAYHTCMWYMTNDGYRIIHSYAPDPLIEAQILGIKLGDNNKPETAGLAYCYARGDNLIGQYFMAKLPENEDEAERTVIALRDSAADFIANMQFLDKKPIGLDPGQLDTRIVELNSGNLELSFPKGLEVSSPGNKVSTLPYELYFTQKLQNGRPFSYLLFAVHAISGPNREEAFRNLAEAYVNTYLDMQMKADIIPAGTTQEYIESNSAPGYAQADIAARSYRYKITAKDNPDMPTLFQITLVRQNNQLYAIYYHSLRTDSASAGGYFTGSTGDVAYDMLRDSLRRFLLKNTER